MNQKKRLGLAPEQADRLTIMLQAEDALKALNEPLARRRGRFHLEYRGKVAVLSLSAAGGAPEAIMRIQPGQRLADRYAPIDPTLAGLAYEIRDRLAKLGVQMFLVIQTPREGARIAKLQLFFDQSRLAALTILETRRNTAITDTEFKL